MREPVVYIVMRRDLGMRRGKEIAQAAHAVLGLGVSGVTPIITLKAGDLAELNSMMGEATTQGVPVHAIHDAGRTEVAPNTLTCAAFGPVLPGHLKLLADADLY